MTTHCYLQSSSPSRTRRLVGLGLTALITTGVVGAASASASADSFFIGDEDSYSCYVGDELGIAPITAGYTIGHCGVAPGEYVDGDGMPGSWFIGELHSPDGTSYTAWFDNIYGLPGVSLPHL